MAVFVRLVIDGGLSPDVVWEMPFPEVNALMEAWAYHPPLRAVIASYLGIKEPEW